MPQQDTQAQPGATALDPRTKVIFPICYIEAAAAIRVLTTHRERAISRGNGISTAYTHALWEGITALESEANQCLRRAIDRGQLLLCWEGSTVVLVNNTREQVAP